MNRESEYTGTVLIYDIETGEPIKIAKAIVDLTPHEAVTTAELASHFELNPEEITDVENVEVGFFFECKGQSYYLSNDDILTGRGRKED